MKNKIFVSYDYILFFKDYKKTDIHKHKMKHLTICLNGIMKCNLGKDNVNTYGYILKEDIYHERYDEINSSQKLAFLIEPSSSLSKEMDNLLGKEDYILLSQEQVNKIRILWNLEMLEPVNIENYNKVMQKIFSICGLKRNSYNILDKRIKLSIDIINEKDMLEDNIVDEIISKINLSKSRFFHLFKENIGISFKDFLLTKKFLRTWTYLGEGKSITEACIHGGFFDSAHYTHFMSQCFGLTTKEELKTIDSIYIVDKL